MENYIIEYKLEGDIASLKWCAYDSDFTPINLDTRFKDWTAKGITALCNVMKEGKLLSFEMLKEKHVLEKHINLKLKSVTGASAYLIELFRKAYNSDTGGEII